MTKYELKKIKNTLQLEFVCKVNFPLILELWQRFRCSKHEYIIILYIHLLEAKMRILARKWYFFKAPTITEIFPNIVHSFPIPLKAIFKINNNNNLGLHCFTVF